MNDEEQRRRLYRAIGLLAPELPLERLPEHKVFRKSCETAWDALAPVIDSLTGEKCLSPVPVGQALLFAAEAVLGTALKNRLLSDAEVRYLFERTTECTVERGHRPG